MAIYNNLTESAEDYLIAGLSVLPCQENKKPIRAEWTSLQDYPMNLEDAEREFRSASTIAVITGMVSGNLEMIDFDAHEKGIGEILEKFKALNSDLFAKYIFYIERSLRGGFHIMYKIDSEEKYGSRVLARWETKETMIETRGDHGYCIVSPSPGYTVISGSLTDLPTLRPDERDLLMSTARTLTQAKKIETEEAGSDSHHDFTDPISWFNWNKKEYAKNLLKDAGWQKSTDKKDAEEWTRPGKPEGVSATWGHKYNALYVFSSNADPFKNECYYTPFQILIILRFRGNYNAGLNWIVSRFFSEDIPYLRIGVDYFKKIKKRDRFGIDGTELKKWKKEEIKEDFGKDHINKIAKFDNFTLVPNNFEHQEVIDNCFNLYHPFRHKEEAGRCEWSLTLMEHIFGEQLNLGLRYLQCLYLHPDRMLPILVLVSTERQTGKTTFLNWLNMIFGDNCVMINPSDLTSDFNSSYATANIIEIEETLIEKSVTVEKLKAISTGKFIGVNEKFIAGYKVPFYGKIIMASNQEDKFARIDQEEIRFFVRKVLMPKKGNHSIEGDLGREIPAFLAYLSSLPPVDFSIGRVPFTTEELKNDSLKAVQEASRSGLYKDLTEKFKDYLLNATPYREEIQVSPIDIKNKWFSHDKDTSIHYIKDTLKKDFKLKATATPIRYYPYGEAGAMSKVGYAYTIKSADLGISVNADL